MRTRGACVVVGPRGFVFIFSAGGRNVHEQGRTLGAFCSVGVWFPFGVVLNSIGQCEARRRGSVSELKRGSIAGRNR